MAFVRAVLDGLLPGYVLCDSPETPTAAFVCNANGFYHAIGRPDQAFAREAVREAIETMGDAEPAALWASTPAWSAVLEPLFDTTLARNEYAFVGLPAQFPAPTGFTLQPFDAALAGRLGEVMDDWVVTTFGGPGRFIAHSFGVVALDEDSIAAFCAGCAWATHDGATEVEIEIATAEPHRRSGLALATGAAFIDECHRRGVLPAWTCDSNNEASDRTARTLGFQFLRRIAGFPVRNGMVLRSGRWAAEGYHLTVEPSATTRRGNDL